MTKSRGSKNIRKEYLNDDFESVCSEDSINYFLNPPEPKNKKYNKKIAKKHPKNDEDSKSVKPLKHDRKKDFETIMKKMQNKGDRLKLFYGDDMCSFDDLDSDILKEVISDRQTDDDSIDESEVLSSIVNEEYIDEQQQNKQNDDLGITITEERETAISIEDNNSKIGLTDEDSEYEINEIIKWKNSEDLLLDNDEEEVKTSDTDNLKDNETDNTFTVNTCQKIVGDEMPMIDLKSEENLLETEDDFEEIEGHEEMLPGSEEECYEIEDTKEDDEEEEVDDEKCKKDEEEKERNSDDKGEKESSSKEELEEKEEIENKNFNEFQNRIQFLTETIAKLRTELNEAKEAVEEEKKATKIPGHVCNMLEPCTVAAQLEERLRARREAAAASYREELQQVERMVTQEIERLEEDMSKLKPLNKLAADWEIPRDPQLRSIMYRHDYMLVASDITLNIPNELKSFISRELKRKDPPALQ